MKHGKRGDKSSRKADTSSEFSPITVRVPHAVAMLGLSRSKLYEFIKSGDIEVVKVGRSTLIPVDSLSNFIAARRSH